MNMRLYQKYFFIVLLLIGILMVGVKPNMATRAYQAPDTTSGGDLLINGDFEVEDPSTHGFKWYPPNHFLALDWYRWWVNVWPSQIPEYDDLRPTGRWAPVSGKHGQVYFKWGARYEAGIYQVVENITPCMPYEFSMYVRASGNIGTETNAKIGLDPQGAKLTIDHVYNDLLGWPPYMQWSAEKSDTLYVWERVAVTAEALSNKMTAVTYANPLYVGPLTAWYDTWWDYGTLYQGNFPGGRLPEPATWNSGYIQNVGAQRQGDQINVTWNSMGPASTQVWYTVQIYSEPVTPTVPLSYTVYFPFVAHSRPIQVTALDPSPVTGHSVNILVPGLKSKDRLTYQVLSRRPDTGMCITEGHGPLEYVIP